MTTNNTLIRGAIDRLDATDEEKDALKEIYHIEGFGGAEDYIYTAGAADEVARDRLLWLRDQREEGLRL